MTLKSTLAVVVFAILVFAYVFSTIKNEDPVPAANPAEARPRPIHHKYPNVGDEIYHLSSYVDRLISEVHVSMVPGAVKGSSPGNPCPDAPIHVLKSPWPTIVEIKEVLAPDWLIMGDFGCGKAKRGVSWRESVLNKNGFNEEKVVLGTCFDDEGKLERIDRSFPSEIVGRRSTDWQVECTAVR